MRLRKRLILLIPILILITLIPKNVFAATAVDLPARVNETYEWGSGMYSMEAEKNTWVTMRGVKNTTDTYNEDTYDNVAIEPSVGYAYYAAKTLGLNDSDMQSVISTSDSWNNTTNVKVRNSSQEIDGTGTLYKRAKQYGTVYYGILEDSIRNNKRVFRIKNDNDVKSNIKVLTDQDTGTYTVGPYKLELNIDSNEYTNEGARILYNELNRTGNEGYSLQNAFAKTNNIGGMNTKEGTNPIFVDEKGKQIIFPDFIPGQEKNFYIRFVPANEGAIVETGNPIINTSYLTKFTANKFIKGTPASIKFGDSSLQKTNKLASTFSDDSKNLSSNKTEVIEQNESSLKKREYGEPAVVKLDDESLQSIRQQLGITSGIETEAMRKVGDMSEEDRKRFYREVQGSPYGLKGRAFDFSHWKDVITIDKNGNIVYLYKENGEYGFRMYENGIETPINVYSEDGKLTDAHHYDMIAYANIGKINSNDPRVRLAMDKAARGIGIRDGTFRPMWLLQEVADQVGSVNIITEMGSAQILYPESITLKQKEALDFVLSYATPQETIAQLNPELRDTTNFEAGTFNSSTKTFGDWLTSATVEDVKADLGTHLTQTSNTANLSNGSSKNITALFVPDNYTYSPDVGYTQKYIPISSEKRIPGAMTLEEVAGNPGGNRIQIGNSVFNSGDIQSFGERGQQIVDNGQNYEVVKSGRHHTLGGDGDAETAKLADSGSNSNSQDKVKETNADTKSPETVKSLDSSSQDQVKEANPDAKNSGTVKLTEVYQSVKNPIEDKEIMQKLLDVYSEGGQIGFYSRLVNFDSAGDNSHINSNDLDQFMIDTYNKYMERVIQLDDSQIQYLESKGINASQMQQYFKSFGKISSKDDLERFFNNSLMQEKINDCILESNVWWHVKSEYISAYTEDKIDIKHRLYIGCQNQDVVKLAQLFIEKCENKKIPYYFKFSPWDAQRDDRLVIYADTDNLANYIGALKEIAQEHPEIKQRCGEPPVLTGKIDGWIGIGDEPQLKEDGSNTSFNEVRSEIISDSIRETFESKLSDLKGKTVTYNGQRVEFNDLLVDAISQKKLEELASEYNRLPQEKKELFLSRYGLEESDFTSSSFKEYMKNHIKSSSLIDKVLELQLGDAITIPTRNGKSFEILTGTISRGLPKVLPIIEQIDSSFVDEVKTGILDKAKAKGIDDTFAFQEGTRERFEQDDAARAAIGEKATKPETESSLPSVADDKKPKPNNDTQQLDNSSTQGKQSTVTKEASNSITSNGKTDNGNTDTQAYKSMLTKQAQASFSSYTDSSGKRVYSAKKFVKSLLEAGADYDSMVSGLKPTKVSEDIIYYLNGEGDTVEIAKAVLPESQRDAIVTRVEGQIKENNKLYGRENPELQRSLEERKQQLSNNTSHVSNAQTYGSPAEGETTEGLKALNNSHKKDIITFDKNGNKTWIYRKEGENFAIVKNGKESIVDFSSNSSRLSMSNNVSLTHHNDMIALAYADELLPVTEDKAIKEALSAVKNKEHASIQVVYIAKEASNKLGSVSIVIEDEGIYLYTPENITLEQKKAIEALLSDKTNEGNVSVAVIDNKPDDPNHVNRNTNETRSRKE